MAQHTSQEPSKLSNELMLKFIVDSMVHLAEEVSDMVEMLEALSQPHIMDSQSQEMTI